MANFKVGQRVKIVPYPNPWHMHVPLFGVETTIIGHARDYEWVLDIPCPWAPGQNVEANSCVLAPLTDPGEEQWAADAVRKVTKPDPVSPKVPVREESNQGECMK